VLPTTEAFLAACSLPAGVKLRALFMVINTFAHACGVEKMMRPGAAAGRISPLQRLSGAAHGGGGRRGCSSCVAGDLCRGLCLMMHVRMRAMRSELTRGGEMKMLQKRRHDRSCTRPHQA
jgi:hypothetical protein